MELTISVRSLRALVDPVLGCAGSGKDFPVLNAVHIESRGKYLVATATDRFRLAMQRQAAPEDSTWPEWSALVPLSTIKSILATFKPSRRDADPLLTLVISEDAHSPRVRVVADGALLDFAEAAITYPLQTGEYPKMRRLFREAIAAESTAGHVGLNPALIAGVLPKGAPAAVIKMGADHSKPVLVTDGEDFISILMPRRLIGSKNEFPSLDGWSDLLADDAPKKAARKSAAKKPAVA